MTTSLSDFGISLTLPDGWYGEIFRVADGVHDSGPLVHFANSPLILGDRNGFAGPVRQTMRPGDAIICVCFGSHPPPFRLVREADGILATVRIDVSPGARGDRLEQFFTSADAVRIQKDMRREAFELRAPSMTPAEREAYLLTFPDGA